MRNHGSAQPMTDSVGQGDPLAGLGESTLDLAEENTPGAMFTASGRWALLS